MESNEELSTLLRLAIGGDMASLGQLLEAQRSWCTDVARRHMRDGILFAIDPEDIVQTAFANATNSIASFTLQSGDPMPNFRAWMKRIIINTIRKANRRRSAGIRDLHSDLLVGSSSHNPLRSLAKKEAQLILSTSLATVSKQHAQVIHMFYFEGLSKARIAEQLGKTQASVIGLIQRAMEALHEAAGHSSEFYLKGRRRRRKGTDEPVP
ncbi:MAG: sigma-70 family RNA polymerase sigma factor [Phycisphaerae bacterium]|nr:sigma-70 family RNA polymerase sigma factor [Phycisphaerae bacterium]